MLACHAGGPGSIPGRCILNFSPPKILKDAIWQSVQTYFRRQSILLCSNRSKSAINCPHFEWCLHWNYYWCLSNQNLFQLIKIMKKVRYVTFVPTYTSYWKIIITNHKNSYNCDSWFSVDWSPSWDWADIKTPGFFQDSRVL